MWVDETISVQNGTSAVVGLGHSSPLCGSIARLDSYQCKFYLRIFKYFSSFSTNYIIFRNAENFKKKISKKKSFFEEK
jgi:hypothetical protein